jgi:putative membrane protein
MTRPLFPSTLAALRRLLAWSLAPALAAFGPIALAQDRSGGATGATGSPGAAGMTGSTSATANRGTWMSGSDRRFVEKAMHGGQAEVELARMAQSHATQADVKAFAQRMQQDHGKANEELTQLANAKFTPRDMKPDAQHRREADRLAKLSGAQFDRAYMRMMVEDHRKTVAEFEKAARSAQDPQIKAFAAKTLPTLQEHLLRAQTVHGALEGGNRTSRRGNDTAPSTGTPR